MRVFWRNKAAMQAIWREKVKWNRFRSSFCSVTASSARLQSELLCAARRTTSQHVQERRTYVSWRAFAGLMSKERRT